MYKSVWRLGQSLLNKTHTFTYESEPRFTAVALLLLNDVINKGKLDINLDRDTSNVEHEPHNRHPLVYLRIDEISEFKIFSRISRFGHPAL